MSESRGSEQSLPQLLETSPVLSVIDRYDMAASHQQIKQRQPDLQSLQTQLQQIEREKQLAEAERDQYKGRLQAIETSKFWQMRNQWIRLKHRLLGRQESLVWTPELPELPPIEPPAPAIPESPYDRWQQVHRPRRSDLDRLAATVEFLPYKPLISVIVPVYNTPASFLREAIASVLDQIYPHWELCLADDASTEPHVPEILRTYAADRKSVV